MIGVFFGWALQQALATRGRDRARDAGGRSWSSTGPGAALAGVLAAILPARRAAKLERARGRSRTSSRIRPRAGRLSCRACPTDACPKARPSRSPRGSRSAPRCARRRSPRASTASCATCRSCRPSDAPVEPVGVRTRRRAARAAPLDRARAGAGGVRPLPGREVRDRPGDRPTASTTTSTLPEHGPRGRPREDRASACAQIVKRNQPFVREEVAARRGARAACRPAVQARDHRGHRSDAEEDAEATWPPARPSRFYRNDGWTDLCLGPHVPSHGQARRVQADEGRRRVLARRREEPAAHAHLRHRVGDEGRPRRVPAPPRGGRAARPPQARRRARPVLVPRGDRLGPRGLPPEGRARPPAHGGLLAAAPRGGAATSS